MGVVLTATSVSITVETLKEMGKLPTRLGNAILGAALIDDILSIVALALITILSDPSVSVEVVLFKVAAFFVLSLALGLLLHKGFEKWMSSYNRDKKTDNSDLGEQYQEVKDFELAAQILLDMHDRMREQGREKESDSSADFSD